MLESELVNLPEADRAALFQLVQSSAAVISIDAAGNILDANEKACELVGYSLGELIGKNPRIFKSGVHDQAFYKDLWDTVLAGRPWRGRICNRKKTGDLIWMDTLISPVKNEVGEVVRFVVLRHDITSEVLEHELLLQRETQLVAASKFATIGEMAGFIAHEIDNPLAAISLRSAMLGRTLSSEVLDVENVKKIAGGIQEILDRISRIVKGLRMFSRDESDAPLETVPIEKIVRDALSFAEDLVIKRGGIIEVAYPSEEEPKVRCHPVQLSQIVVNLLKNASDSMSTMEVKIEKKIWIEIREASGRVEVRVSNAGPPIPEAIRKNLFRPYFTTKPRGEGTGIGLAVSRKLAEAHGGKLWFDSQSPRTCFVLELPGV